MKFAKLAVAAVALAAAPAFAQDANPQVVAGAVVTGPQGEAVGTIETVADGIVTLDTGKHKAPLPVAAFGQGEAGPTITVTQVQLNGMIDDQLAAAAAKRDAAIIVGAAVLTADAQDLGTIDLIDGDNVVIIRGDTAEKVTLLREFFAANDAGLTARLTLQQIDDAMAALPAQ